MAKKTFTVLLISCMALVASYIISYGYEHYIIFREQVPEQKIFISAYVLLLLACCGIFYAVFRKVGDFSSIQYFAISLFVLFCMTLLSMSDSNEYVVNNKEYRPLEIDYIWLGQFVAWLLFGYTIGNISGAALTAFIFLSLEVILPLQRVREIVDGPAYPLIIIGLVYLCDMMKKYSKSKSQLDTVYGEGTIINIIQCDM